MIGLGKTKDEFLVKYNFHYLYAGSPQPNLLNRCLCSAQYADQSRSPDCACSQAAQSGDHGLGKRCNAHNLQIGDLIMWTPQTALKITRFSCGSRKRQAGRVLQFILHKGWSLKKSGLRDSN